MNHDPDFSGIGGPGLRTWALGGGNGGMPDETASANDDSGGGAAVGGAAVSVIAALVGHDAWTIRGSSIWFAAGAILGAFLLTPIALAEAFRTGLSHLLGPYQFHIRRYVSLTMVAALGYLLATRHLGGFGNFSLWAIAIFIIGAMIQTAMEILFEHRGRRVPSRSIAADPSAPKP